MVTNLYYHPHLDTVQPISETLTKIQWPFTLNQYRLYDMWTGVKETSVYPANYVSLQVLATSFQLAHKAHSLTFRSIIILTGLVATGLTTILRNIYFFEACKRAIAFCLWIAVKGHLVATRLFSGDMSPAPALPKSDLFLIADSLSMKDRLEFFKLQPREMLVSYLKELMHPERIEELYRHSAREQMTLPEAWEEALYKAGPFVKKLHFTHEHAPHIIFEDIVRKFPNLEELSLTDCTIDASSLPQISKLQSLKNLTIARILVKSEGGSYSTPLQMACFTSLPQLESIELALDNPLLEWELKSLVTHSPKLHSITFRSCSGELTSDHIAALLPLQALTLLRFSGHFTVTKAALDRLGELSQLTSLTLDSSSPRLEQQPADIAPLGNLRKLCALTLSAQSLQPGLLAKLQSLETLCLSNCAGVDDTIIQEISGLSSLKRLALDTEPDAVSDTSLQQLGKLHLLEVCVLKHTAIALTGLQELVSGCKKLHTLHLTDTVNLRDKDLSCLTRLPNLHTLSLNECHTFSDNAIQEVAAVTTLVSFSYVSSVYITPASWRYWSQHKALRELLPSSTERAYTQEEISLLPRTLTSFNLNHDEVPNLHAVSAHLPTLKKLQVRHLDDPLQRIQPSTFDALCSFPSLEELHCYFDNHFESSSAIKREGFLRLSRMPNMRKIVLSHTDYRDLSMQDLPPTIVHYYHYN